MAGKGPDLFILDTDLYNRAAPYLFQDTEKAMRGGVFCDLPAADEGGRHFSDDYIAPLLQAGRVDGRQYIVPINYEVLSVLTNDITVKSWATTRLITPTR
jgi:ABC-type glycerol-3-phosphate transport system substrate-binding protein